MVENTDQPPQSSVIQVLDDVEIARQTLQLLQPGDDAYYSALSNYANKLMVRFRNSGNPSDLNEGVMRRKELLELTKPGDPVYLQVLNDTGMALRTRFMVGGDVEDLTEAIKCFEVTFKSCTPEHPFYLGAVGNLASVLLKCYRTYADVAALDRVIQISSTALALASPDDRNRDSLLNNFANALNERFQRQGDRADLDMALVHYKECLDLRPPGHRLRYTVLANLADAMLAKFEADGDIQDVESATQYYTSAIQLCSPGQEGYLSLLTSLGVTFWYSWMKGGDPPKLDMAIDCYSRALTQSITPNMDRVRILDNYGAALVARYSQSKDTDDLNQAIEFLTTSLAIQPPTFLGRNITLLHIGTALFARFSAVGNVADLETAIENLESALQLCPPTHQYRHSLLSSYGRALSARFDEKGDEQDLALAAAVCKEALTLASPTASTYQVTIANLTTTMLISLRVSGNSDEFQKIIDLCDRALTMPQLNTEFIILKSNRAKAFLERFKSAREKRDIDIAVDSLREVLPLLPEGHTEYIPAHFELAVALETRFQLTSRQEDLDESIMLYRIARRDCRRGNFNYVQMCINLGNALRTRFESANDAVDGLDEAIVLLSEAEEILTGAPKHAHYKTCLINLGFLFFARFGMQKRKNDLDEAIQHVSHALTLPTSSENFVVQVSLAMMLHTRSRSGEDLDDLEQSIMMFEAASQKMPPKHLFRALLCRGYGRALIHLALHRDPIHHLDSAIRLFQESMEHLPESHPDRLLTYMSLAHAYYQRSLLLNDNDGLLEAKHLLQKLAQMVPDDHPLMHDVQRHSADLYLKMYNNSHPREPVYLEAGIAGYEKAARYSHTHGYECVGVGLDWVNLAEKFGHPSALRAYQTSLSSLDHFLLTTASVKNRHAIFLDDSLSSKHAGSLGINGTACAIDHGQVELAVELSEQGRGLLWSQLARIRAPLDSLRSADEEGKELASEFERIGSQLARNVAPQYETNVISQRRLSIEEATRRYRQLTDELNAVVSRIQAKDGFQSFLGRMSFRTLQFAAAKGPVILVNISRRRCDAIIILRDERPRLVPLPNATIDDITAMSTDLYQSLKATSRAGEEKLRERQIVPILRNVWNVIVSPIVDELSTFLPRGSRIWWCPTSKLTSLPLHAAGPYRKGVHNLFNIYISSYTPTLTALIRSRSEGLTASTGLPSLIAIGQAKPSSPSSTAELEPELKSVDSELALVRSLLPTRMSFHTLSGEDSTAQAVLGALRTHSWVHLACHGMQDLAQPFDSSFALKDRPVTLLDIVRAREPSPSPSSSQSDSKSEPTPSSTCPDANLDPAPSRADFAFLSACHTAVGDAHTPDEIIHLAAGMHFSGFRSVIGTMWAVDDEMAQKVVEAFYKCLFASADAAGDGDGVDCTNAAKALNKALKTVDPNVVSFDQRIVFIHIGV